MNNTPQPGDTVGRSKDELHFLARLRGVHAPGDCAGETCVIHSPTNHHMRDWAISFRNDRGIVERHCPTHGVGHPDPDQWEYWKRTETEWNWIHGCCGCCHPITPKDAP